MTLRKAGMLCLFLCLTMAAALTLVAIAPVNVLAHPGDPDDDGDGVDNALDLCPLVNGAYWNQGCPEVVLPTVSAATAVPTPVPTVANPVTGRNFQPTDRDRLIALRDVILPLPTRTLTLANPNGDPRTILGELTTMGLISAVGRTAVQQNYMFLNGRGDLFLGLGGSAPSTNLVISAQLNFTSADTNEFELCSIQARVTRDGQRNASSYVDIAWLNDGSVAVIDRSQPTGDATTIARANAGLTLGTPHNLLAVLNGATLSLFVDGELVLDGVTVAEREGIYGLSLVGRAATSPRCDARNIWVQAF